jgi:hypothetical protein
MIMSFAECWSPILSATVSQKSIYTKVYYEIDDDISHSKSALFKPIISRLYSV